jgi:hypothetical protein
MIKAKYRSCILLLAIAIIILIVTVLYVNRSSHRGEAFQNETPTFHVLIATVGRPSVHTLLDSLIPQLTERDHITIVFDNKSEVPQEFKQLQSKCQIHTFNEPVGLGHWGHGIRNKYASLLDRTDFIMHADDDDTYVPGAFDALRRKCTDTKTLYIAKMKSGNETIPRSNVLELGNVGTPCGIIPYDANKQGKWEYFYGGDFAFYKSLKPVGGTVFLENVIYNVRA